MTRDLIVIGGGWSGTAAALAARESGLDVVLVEIRKRTARYVAEVALAEDLCTRPLSRAPRDRIPEVFGQAVRRAGEVAAAALDRRDRALARLGVPRLVGPARLTGEPGVVVVDARAERETLRSRWVLLATGTTHAPSRPCRVDDGVAADRGRLFDAGEPPASALVVGGGREGVGLAGLLACAGTEVTLAEAASRLLPDADADVSDAVRRLLEAAGARVLLARQVTEIACEGDVRRARTVATAVGAAAAQAGAVDSVETKSVLLAGGGQPAFEGLGLEALGSAVTTPLPPQEYATAVDWLFVAGSAAGRSVNPATARREGRAAVAFLRGRREHVPHRDVPTVVAGAGGCGWVGLTEVEGSREGHSLLVGRAKLAGSGAVHPGFVKVIADASSQRILGVHVAGAQGREAVAVAGPFVELGLSRTELSAMSFAPGSPADALAEAAGAAVPP